MSEQRTEVAISATYCEAELEQLGSEPDMCIHLVALRIDGLGEWRTYLTIEEAIGLRAQLYVALCAAGVTYER